MINLPFNLLSLYYRAQVRRFHAAALDPAGTQSDWLENWLRRVATTEMGRRHRLAEVRDVATFRQRVPVQSYTEMEADLTRVYHGEQNIVWPERPVAFVQTSGTTNRSKILPVTAQLARDCRDAQLNWVIELLRENPYHALGRSLVLVSSRRSRLSPGQLQVGAATGRISRTMPWTISMKAVPHERIIDIETEELRSYLTVLAAAGRSVGTITTANATNVLALVRRLGLWAPALVEDLRRGGLPQRILTDGGQERSVSWTAAQQRRLAGLFRPRGRRAERLRRILHRPDWCLTELWPQLTAVNCWRGGVSSFFLERLAPRLGGLPVRDPGYSASEGVFAIPIESGTAAGVPHLTGNFFEFVPAAEDPRHADARGVHELEQGAEYRVIVTTAGGLMRYDMGDIVAVEGRYRAAPLLAFRRKAGSMLNLTGEKLAEDQVVSAVRRAAAQSGVDLEGFTLTARLEEVPIPLLLAEAAGAVAPERLARFEALLDAELCLANEEYEAKRRSGRLAGATVYWLASGALRCYQADRVAQGAPPTQVKLPAVSAPDAVPRVLQPEGWAQ